MEDYCGKENIITIHALGDSLVTAYGDDESNFIGGWGRSFVGVFFDPDYVHVNVYAQGGRSSMELLNEGRFVDNGNFTESDFPYNTGRHIPYQSRRLRVNAVWS